MKYNYLPYTSKFLSLLLSFLLLSFLVACGGNKPEALKLEGKTMGTLYHINIPIAGNIQKVDPKRLKVEIDDSLRAINQEMSTYINDSMISQFNRTVGSDWYPVSNEFFKVIQAAQTISQSSDGAFDISVMPLVNLWGFGTKDKLDFPSQAKIDEQLSQIGYQFLELQETPSAIRKQKDTLSIDLSAIAKGYGVDAIAALLTKKGITNYMVEIGGEIRVRGKNKLGKLWRIAIEKPTVVGRSIQQGLKLDNISVATSGDYRNYYEKDGVRYSHTIDPKTGKPITHKLASVTVLDESAMIADAQATTIMVLGEKRGKEYALEQGLKVYMIFRENDTFSVWHNLSEDTLMGTPQ